jgi:hypothetical protein
MGKSVWETFRCEKPVAMLGAGGRCISGPASAPDAILLLETRPCARVPLAQRGSSDRVHRSCRGVAQPGRAPGSGPGGRRFKSSLPDQFFQALKARFWISV